MTRHEQRPIALRIALVDDHVLFRDGLRTLVSAEDDLLVVAEASDARSAFPLLEETTPDVLVVDVTLSGSSGIALTREVLRCLPTCKVLVLTMHASEEYVIQAFAAGATGYALKSQPAAEVLEAIRAVGRGESYLAPTLPRPGPDDAGGKPRDDGGTRLDELSPREREIFDLLVRSHSNREIAKHLYISVKTVETHRASINRKLGVHSTAELIRFAALRGLVHE
jgi:DNA-binding NarL/FixJ family response regulator